MLKAPPLNPRAYTFSVLFLENIGVIWLYRVFGLLVAFWPFCWKGSSASFFFRCFGAFFPTTVFSTKQTLPKLQNKVFKITSINFRFGKKCNFKFQGHKYITRGNRGLSPLGFNKCVMNGLFKILCAFSRFLKSFQRSLHFPWENPRPMILHVVMVVPFSEVAYCCMRAFVLWRIIPVGS